MNLRLSLTLCAQALLLASALLLGGCKGPQAANPAVPPGARSSGGLHAIVDTDKGSIEVELLAADSPKAVENFRLLAEHGYYNGLVFHRIMKGFMIQGGDPLGNGTGGESAWGGTFADDIKTGSELYARGYTRGIVAMANRGPDTNGSQFFIMHEDYEMPPRYVIFGKVIKGMEVVDALANTPTEPGPEGEMSKPVVPPVIRKVTIIP